MIELLKFCKTDRQKEVIKLLSELGSTQLVAEALGIRARSVRKIRQRVEGMSGVKRTSKSRVGIIGDTHVPYEHRDYLDFCKKTFKKHRVDTIIMIGDLVDHHALSFHDSEPSLKGASGEYIDARERLRPWYKAFPSCTVILGNHDKIPQRQLNKIGIDADVWMRPIDDVYEFPKGWKTETEVKIDGVLYHHGETAGGVNGFRNDAIHRMCNTVSGHNHSNAGISATASQHRLVWGMAVGCGVDNKSMAFVYGKHFKNKPIIACGTVLEGAPQIHYMDLGED